MTLWGHWRVKKKKKSKGLPLKIHWPLTFIWCLTLIIETCYRKDWTAPKQLESNNKRAADVLKPYFWRNKQTKKKKDLMKCLLFCKNLVDALRENPVVALFFLFCFVLFFVINFLKTATSKISHAEILRHRRRLIHHDHHNFMFSTTPFHPSSQSHTRTERRIQTTQSVPPPVCIVCYQLI